MHGDNMSVCNFKCLFYFVLNCAKMITLDFIEPYVEMEIAKFQKKVVSCITKLKVNIP